LFFKQLTADTTGSKGQPAEFAKMLKYSRGLGSVLHSQSEEPLWNIACWNRPKKENKLSIFAFT